MKLYNYASPSYLNNQRFVGEGRLKQKLPELTLTSFIFYCYVSDNAGNTCIQCVY